MLRVLVVDAELARTDALRAALDRAPAVQSVSASPALPDGPAELAARGINVIFVDPLGFDLDDAAAFIFRIRKAVPTIVFVLHMRRSAAEPDLFRGERSRLRHYFALDKDIPDAWLDAELAPVLDQCRYGLRWIEAMDRVGELRDSLTSSSPIPESRHAAHVLDGVHDRLRELLPHGSGRRDGASAVFVSYRFEERELGGRTMRALSDAGFAPVSGENVYGSIGRLVIERIRAADYFLCLMTRVSEKTTGGFTCSPWLLEEKGVALAYDKRIVLLVEDGVSDFGLMQGDWERIHFHRDRFDQGLERVITQLKAFRALP